MFKISMKIFKVNSKSKDTSNKSSKFSQFFRSIVNKKPTLSINDLGQISIESIKETSPLWKLNRSMSQFSPLSIDNVMVKNELFRKFINLGAKIIEKIPIFLGVFGGLCAIYLTYLSNIDRFDKELEIVEYLTIVY